MLKNSNNIFSNYFYKIEETETETKKTINWNNVFFVFMAFSVIVSLLIAVTGNN